MMRASLLRFFIHIVEIENLSRVSLIRSRDMAQPMRMRLFSIPAMKNLNIISLVRLFLSGQTNPNHPLQSACSYDE